MIFKLFFTVLGFYRITLMVPESKGLVIMADNVVREKEVFKFYLASTCITKGRTKHDKNESNVKLS